MDQSHTSQEPLKGSDTTFGTVKLSNSPITAPSSYIRSLSSKSSCSKIIDAFNVWLHVPIDIVDVLKQVCEDLHNASLILDDIQDESPLRRGNTATHLVFGTAQAINGANYMIIQATKTINSLKNPAMMMSWLDDLENQFVGQSWDVKWRDEMHCPSEEEYFAMIDLKTGIVIKKILRLMQAAKNDDGAHLDRLAQLLGRWYQIRDDYMNLQGAEYTRGKGFCEDLDEGKISLMLVKCCHSSPVNRDIIMGIFRNRLGSRQTPLPVECKMQILNMMEKSGALQQTWELIMAMKKEIEEEIGCVEVHFGEENAIFRLMVTALGDVPAP
ncbi:hypothetical protein ASPWEDRAFT_672800 [Aspergillus wentii DTO 134E9]|uniref:Uncharacterized protein n=1 Tax=Aspergillus wentii DTO 134E9 TaxID=1073089 RepID=A0A1L9R7I1_ASPWE|nr:uncharacterized protein ASPWEDRAFT_672800 [Aspergillus wentii DTO 134E9]KAI9927461.1 hypothetical protein MW887_003075 [Aspergillus wentii]OJJ30837.1 hypothetical protein ASPWEDRAFT_672800 [Aspergillus wentii DTO 134E9]